MTFLCTNLLCIQMERTVMRYYISTGRWPLHLFIISSILEHLTKLSRITVAIVSVLLI